MKERNEVLKLLVVIQIILTVIAFFAMSLHKSSLLLGTAIGEIVFCIFLICELFKIRADIYKFSKEPKEGSFEEFQSLVFREDLNCCVNMLSEVRKEADMESKYREIQLQTLMNQINPHFLYNTLDSIRGQALYAEDYLVADMTETLSRFFRYCITRKGVLVSISDEVENMNLYLKILNFRMASKFEFRYELESREILDCEIPKLTLQPIIENAVNHGIYDFVEGGEISLHIRADDNTVMILVHDNGVGMDPQTLATLNEKIEKGQSFDVQKKQHKEHSGIALHNIHERIRLLYGDVYGLHVYSTQGSGTTVQVCFPRKSFEEAGLCRNS